MKILWIKSDFPLPADTGGKIRTWNLLAELAKRHQVTFLSYAPPDHPEKWFDQMRGKGITTEPVPLAEEKKQGIGFYLRVVKGLLSFRPYIANKYVSKAMSGRLCALLKATNFDVLLCDFLEMAWCADLVKSAPVVLFEHNVETMIWRRYHQTEENLLKKLYFSYEKLRMERFERRIGAGRKRITMTDLNLSSFFSCSNASPIR